MRMKKDSYVWRMLLSNKYWFLISKINKPFCYLESNVTEDISNTGIYKNSTKIEHRSEKKRKIL